MATLKDIAKIAGVNVSTVSKALRGATDLNPNTVAKIRQAAKQLNYTYSHNQRASNVSNIVGIVCPEILSSYYMDILDSFQKHIAEAGYQTLVMVSSFLSERERTCVEQLIKYQVRGILCITEDDANVEQYRELSELSDIAFTLISPSETIDFCDSIFIDDRQGALLAANHLTSLGHKQIAYIGDQLSRTRKEFFLEALQNEGVIVPEEYIAENELRFENCGYLGMKKLLALPNRPTGVFAAYDNIAIGAMRAVYEAGLSIPEDLSIVSIDNIKTSSYLYKNLSSVTEPTHDLGEMASALIIDKITGQKKIIQNIKLRPTLNIRETTAAPKK